MATNENLIPIPGRLHSVATEGHVAGADEIYDDALGKTQAQINQESQTLPDNLAYLGDDDGQAVIPGFDPQTDTLHKAAQVLTTAEKDQVAQNLNNRPSTNGMARIELKATDNFKSVVEAQTGGNTVFVIKYDYTLTGNVTVPANCVLEFDGGSVSGAYTINGQGTQIVVNGLYTVISLTTTLTGTWKAKIAYSDWFGIVNDCVIDETTKAYVSGTNSDRGLKNLFLFTNIIFSPGSYFFEGTTYTSILSGTHVDGQNATLKFKWNNNTKIALWLGTASNVIIENLHLIGGKPDDTDTTEIGIGIYISGKENIIVRNVIAEYFRGDGFYIGGSSRDNDYPHNVSIINCQSLYSHRNGLSITGGRDILIQNSVFAYTNGTAPQCGLDIEINNTNKCHNVNIVNCEFHDNAGEKSIVVMQAGGTPEYDSDNYVSSITDINIEKCVCKESITLRDVTRCKVDGSYGGEIYLGAGTLKDVLIENSTASVITRGGDIRVRNLTIKKCIIHGTSENTNFYPMKFIGANGNQDFSHVTFEDITIDGYPNGLRVSNGEYITYNNVRQINSTKASGIPLDLQDNVATRIVTGCNAALRSDSAIINNNDYYFGKMAGFLKYNISNSTPTWYDGTTFRSSDGEVATIRRIGTFAQKPTPTNPGFRYHNTDTHKDMTWDGTNWYYGDGTLATS